MSLFIVFIFGIGIALWLEHSGRTEIVISANLWVAVFVLGMLSEASLSGALIDFALTPADVPADVPVARLLSLPLASVLLFWVCVMAGYLVGRLAWLLRLRMEKPRPA